MGLPPNVKSILPSLRVEDDRIATLAIADIRRQLPSLRISSGREDVADGAITLSIEDLRKLLRIALAGVEVDEKWYLTQVPELGKAIEVGAFKLAAEHYQVHGYLEGRLPKKPIVDEEFYCQAYPDIAQAIRSGKLKSASEHYFRSGYSEGRNPIPPPTIDKKQRVTQKRQPTPAVEPAPNRRADPPNSSGSAGLKGNPQRHREGDGPGLRQRHDRLSVTAQGSRLRSTDVAMD